MIRDLSTTLRAMLTQPGLPSELSTTQVVFDRPVAQFNPSQSTINLFLFDIRENVELREYEPTVSRRNGEAIIYRPPMRVDCSYLITAWPVGGSEVALQEHLLLSQVLQVFSRYPTIPKPFLQGSLQSGADESLPIPLSVTGSATSRQSTEFWTSLGIPVRAYLVVTTTIALDLNDVQPEPVPLVTSHAIAVGGMTAGSAQEQSFQIGGQIRLADQKPLAAAQVTLLEQNQTTQSDSAGLYQFAAIPAGTYTLQVQSPDGTSQQFPLTVPALNARSFDMQLNS